MRGWKGLKKWPFVAMAAAIAASVVTPIQAWASSDYKYITSISLKVDIDLDAGDEICDGDSLGTDSDDSGNKVYTSSSKYSIQSAEWSTDDEVGIGDTPKITVWLEPESSSSSDYEYRFRSSYSSGSVSVSGGTFVSASRSGSDLKVVIRADGIKGTYEPPEDAEWSDSRGRARWEEPESGGSDYYDVILYRGSSVVKKLEEYKGTSYNFYPYMTKEGDYSFKVRTVPHTEEEKRRGKKSDWMEGGDLYIAEDEVSDGSGQESGNGGGTTTPSGGNTDVGWRKEGDTWYFKYPDGNYHKNGWLHWNGKWYLFDEAGRMLTGWRETASGWYYLGENGDMKTGWVQTNNIWYYLNPNQDGPEGAMVKSSWLTIDGKTYFLNENGAMAEGWYEVQGNWYYFYPGQGHKAVNTSISGFVLDANGIWQH